MPLRPASPEGPICELILKRAASNSRPGKRDDPHRIALCIEGGAMRGVISAGMVLALEQLGLLNAFDGVFGSSAGALNGAYFLAGQAALGTTIYYEDINNRNFIDFARLLRRRPIVDIDFVVWDVLVKRKALNVDRVLNSPIPLFVIATNVDSGAVETLSEFTEADDLLHALRAGATMPIVAGPPYRFRDARYWDPLFSQETIPVGAAERLGFTHILVLLTRGDAPLSSRVTLIERLFVVPRITRESPILADHYMKREVEYMAVMEHIGRLKGPAGGAIIHPVRPALPLLGKLERRRDHLIAGASRGIQAIVDLFAEGSNSVGEILQAHSSNGLAPRLRRLMDGS